MSLEGSFETGSALLRMRISDFHNLIDATPGLDPGTPKKPSDIPHPEARARASLEGAFETGSALLRMRVSDYDSLIDVIPGFDPGTPFQTFRHVPLEVAGSNPAMTKFV